MYTLLMLDITSIQPAYWVHWAVVNIPASDVSSLNVNDGQEVVSYFNPAVTADYQFLLICQSQQFTGNFVADYTSSPPEFGPFCPPGR